MDTARRSLRPSLALTIAFVATLLELGCFKPNIKDGGFVCAMSGVKCPEGFTCFSDNRCWRPGHVVPDGGMDGDAPGASDADGSVSDASDASDACVTFDTFVPPDGGCTPLSSGMCDPVCQTGCTGCRQKCSVVASVSMQLTCNVVTALPVKGVTDFCAIFAEGNVMQADNCGPGLVCMNDGCPTTRCYKYCRTNRDCPNSLCDRDGPGGSMVCDIPFNDACDPLQPAQFGCPDGQACYLSSTNPLHTLCDCPMAAGGVGAQCDRSRECFGGLVCVSPAGGAARECRKVCRLDGTGPPAVQCASGVTACRQFRGNSSQNPPNPTFGFCVD